MTVTIIVIVTVPRPQQYLLGEAFPLEQVLGLALHHASVQHLFHHILLLVSRGRAVGWPLAPLAHSAAPTDPGGGDDDGWTRGQGGLSGTSLPPIAPPPQIRKKSWRLGMQFGLNPLKTVGI